MKKIKIKFDDIITLDNLKTAFEDCRKTKKNRKDTLFFELNLGKELSILYRELKNQTYKISPYCMFKLYEPKEREIFQPRLKDLIVQRLLYNAIYDEVDKRLFKHSYGVRKVNGMHQCAMQAAKFAKSSDENNYYLQMDIKKFFKNIKKEHFKNVLEYYFKDKKLKDMLLMFMFDVGVPIGNLLSGIFGMMFLTKMDFFIKHNLKVEKYIRFMDDFVIFDISKEQALYYKNEIEKFIDGVGLTFSKVKINKIKQGINFVGFRTFKHYRLLRKRTIKHFRKGDIYAKSSIFGMTKHCKTRDYFIHILHQQGYLDLDFSKNYKWIGKIA